MKNPSMRVLICGKLCCSGLRRSKGGRKPHPRSRNFRKIERILTWEIGCSFELGGGLGSWGLFHFGTGNLALSCGLASGGSLRESHFGTESLILRLGWTSYFPHVVLHRPPWEHCYPLSLSISLACSFSSHLAPMV